VDRSASHHPRRRARREQHPAPDFHPPIVELAHAIETAWGIHEHFGRAHAAFVLSASGEVLDAWAVDRPHHTPEEALGLALAGDSLGRGATAVLVVSARGDDDLSVLAEDDLATWRRMLARLEERGLLLLDWMVAAGDLFRSLRFSTDPRAEWPWPTSR
jgi:hypothetical protein